MKIYQIILSKRGIKSTHSRESLRPLQENLVEIEGYDCIFDDISNLYFSNKFMQDTYGISLSPAEIACFHSHKLVWSEFEKSGREWCLILEDDAVLKCDILKMYEMVDSLPSDWHLFFPYDNTPTEIITYKNQEPHALGKQWGAYAYFINKSALPYLLNLDCIRPIDDELLTLSITKAINGYYFETDLFETDGAISYIRDQKQHQILKSMLNVNCWNEADKLSLRNMLQILSNAAAVVGVHLILEGGTLLGQIRHGQVIQWDDDVDLAIVDSELDRFLNYLKDSTSIHYKKIFEVGGGVFYKIWTDGNHKIEGFEYSWPFVDLWTFKLTPTLAVFNSIGKMNHEIVLEDIYPLALVDFEGLPFHIPSNYQRVLNMQYPFWKEKMRIYPYSHRYEKPMNYPLATSISVDENGRIIL